MTNIDTIDPRSDPSIALDGIKHRLEQGYILREAVIIGASTVFPRNAHNTLTLVFFSDKLGEDRLNIRGANFGFPGNGPIAAVNYIFEAAGGEQAGVRKDLLEQYMFAEPRPEEHVRTITQFK